MTYTPNTASNIVVTTAGSGSPNIITAAQSGTIFSNEGTAAENYNTLPAAAVGLRYGFMCKSTNGMRITASAGDVIRLGSDVAAETVAGGYVKSVTAGSVINLVALNSTDWYGQIVTGTWTIDA